MTFRQIVTLAVLALITGGIAFVLAVIGNRPPGPDQEPGRKPALVFDSLEHDFGVIQQGQDLLIHVFAVENQGPTPVKLRVIGLGCNCLALDCPETVGPGEKGQIGAKLELRGREGPFSTRVTIGTSDPAMPTVSFTLSFYAQPHFDIDPPAVVFFEADRGQQLVREVRIITRQEHEEAESAPPVIVASSPVLRCELLDKHLTVDPRSGLQLVSHHYRLRLDTNSRDGESGNRAVFSFRVKLAGEPDSAFKEVPVEVNFRHHRWLSGQTSLSLQLRETDIQPRVSLWSRDGNPFVITKVTSSLAEVSARPAGSTPALKQDILFAVSTGAGRESGKSLAKGKVSVYTAEHPNDPYSLEILLLP